MNITIPKNEEQEYEDEFFDWIIEYARNHILGMLDDKKLQRIDEYINSNKLFSTLFKKSISSKEVLTASLYNMKVVKYWNRTVITFDTNEKLPNTNAKLVDIVKLINYGTLSVIGYPIITKAFKEIEDDIEALYEKFKEEQ